MRIGVVGGGVVGHATARSWIEWHEVRVHDVLPERSTHSLQDVLESDIIFVCLPTPQQENSLACDCSYIANFFEKQFRSTKSFVLRSTVPIGTTKNLRNLYQLPNLIHSPEFLTARCAVVDVHLPSRNIIGGPLESPAARLLWSMYHKRFPGVPIFTLTSDESEAVKLFQNGFFAVKIAYWNEVRTLADKHNLRWNEVLAAVLADGRIAHSHTKVPGPDGRRGFSGACLPKDLANLINCFEMTELTIESAWVTRAALERNEMDRCR